MTANLDANDPERSFHLPVTAPTDTTGVPVLSVRGLKIALRRSGGRSPIVDGIDLDLYRGEITGLVGASGSGKSLTALALMGLTSAGTFQVDADRLTVAGQDVDVRAHDLARDAFHGLRGGTMAMVFQDPATALDPVFRVGWQIARPLRRQLGLSAEDARERVVAALTAVGFDAPVEIMERFPHELSGGQRQRCVIAMAQALGPAVLLADEPTTALDTVTQQSVLTALERLARDHDTAVLLISHDLRLVAQHADKVNVMQSGRLVECLPATELGRGGQHPVTRALIEALPRLDAPPETPGPGDWHGTSGDTTPLLEVDGLSCRYRIGHGRSARHIDALRGVSLALHRGETHGIAGASGCGKSTLARALVQLVPVDSGQVLLDGQARLGARGTALQEARRRIQLVFQDPGNALSPRRNVAQTLTEAARHFRLDASPEALRASLAAVDLEADALGRLPGEFSSGQRQRIAIARALVCQPDILVADEALSALDVQVQAQILALFRRLRRERGLSLLLISHDLAVLRETSDRISVMEGGQIVESGTAARIFGAPRHEATHGLLAAIPRLGSDGR